jgi:arabinose-5-phosphate isomerase
MQHKNLPLNSHINSAINTIKTEILGLESLINFFDDKYIQSIELILKCQGKIILSGMGKSGHIAKKISATLASTGTPSFFIHPAEASHGDLGMIAKNDIVILLSNSGETKELRDIIYYCKRFSIPIISIIRKLDSELGNASTIALVIPAIAEANSINAPTTSTTMMLALGDCIAVSLLEARDFNSQNFSTFHPGGKLGSAFIKVKDIMRTNNLIPIVNTHSKMTNVLLEMTSKHLGCTAVIDDNENLVGIITDGDLRRHLTQNFLQDFAENIMTNNPLTINQNMLIGEVIAIMNKKSITNIFVIDSQKIIGIVHLHDCLKAGV